jgi:hypothetical protein
MSASGWGKLPSGLLCSALPMIDASAYSNWSIEPRRPKA